MYLSNFALSNPCKGGILFTSLNMRLLLIYDSNLSFQSICPKLALLGRRLSIANDLRSLRLY